MLSHDSWFQSAHFMIVMYFIVPDRLAWFRNLRISRFCVFYVVEIVRYQIHDFMMFWIHVYVLPDFMIEHPLFQVVFVFCCPVLICAQWLYNFMTHDFAMRMIVIQSSACAGFMTPNVVSDIECMISVAIFHLDSQAGWVCCAISAGGGRTLCTNSVCFFCLAPDADFFRSTAQTLWAHGGAIHPQAAQPVLRSMDNKRQVSQESFWFQGGCHRSPAEAPQGPRQE